MISGILTDICRNAYLPFVINRYLTIVARLDHPPIVLHQPRVGFRHIHLLQLLSRQLPPPPDFLDSLLRRIFTGIYRLQ
ncbi:hypothetical protein LM592_04090 [Candidatus Acetothermia bacterium]|nr:hypothetical protein [Candidatus Acetothermia bacterium]MCI2428487.1 hypothetical protein [Candidatus Acetothermia bacterium]